MKKIILYLSWFMFVSFLWINFSFSLNSEQFAILDSNESFPYDSDDTDFTDWKTTDSRVLLKESTTLLEEQMEAQNLGEYISTEWAWLTYIKNIINFFLTLLWLIATIIIIYGFYLMVVPWWKSDEQLKTAKKYVKIATIAIIMIWLSRLIVQFIFEIYNTAK